MKINESELKHELEFMHEASTTSSFEDFWMFLSFAMVLVAFVLMGYISYLKKLEVDTVKKYAEKQIKDHQKPQDTETHENDINIYLHKDENGIYLTVDEDNETRIGYDQLATIINSKLKNIKGNKVFFNIYSPGEYYYEDVMKVCFIITSPDITVGREIALNLMYKEEKVEAE